MNPSCRSATPTTSTVARTVTASLNSAARPRGWSRRGSPPATGGPAVSVTMHAPLASAASARRTARTPMTVEIPMTGWSRILCTSPTTPPRHRTDPVGRGTRIDLRPVSAAATGPQEGPDERTDQWATRGHTGDRPHLGGDGTPGHADLRRPRGRRDHHREPSGDPQPGDCLLY